ncbi:MAG: hypothetical protein WC858_03500 [Parcubacteria group bacterium]|jgi:hypothetical protein
MQFKPNDVKKFKDVCDENDIIPVILKENLAKYFVEPILDVGSGKGEIMSQSFPEKRVIHIDIQDFSEFKISQNHTREITDFFSYEPQEKIGTVFLSHALQFIDDDIVLLNKKLSEISPDYLVVVANTNKDFMGDLLTWIEKNFKNSNPEIELLDFPRGYVPVESAPFTAKVELPDYDQLALQIAYLFDIRLKQAESSLLANYLSQKLSAPSFTIDQEIKVYRKINS